MTLEEATKIASLVDNDVSVVCPLFRKCDDCAIKQQCGDDEITVDPKKLMEDYNKQLDTRKDDEYVAYLVRKHDRIEIDVETTTIEPHSSSVWIHMTE